MTASDRAPHAMPSPPRSIAELPEILEIKRRLRGADSRFSCRVVDRAGGALVVLFVSDRAYQVADLALPVGTVTLGYFWPERPYNVYHWMTPDGATLAFYFNLSDETHISTDELRWRDLVLDVLVRPGRQPEVLDEHELPLDLSSEERQAVDAARVRVLADAEPCTRELEAASALHFARLFGRARP